MAVVTDHAMSVDNMVFVFLAEQFNAAGDTAGGGVTKRAECFASDVVADIHQQVYIFLFAVTMLKAFQDFGEPVRSFATGSAFAARLVAVELGHAQYSANDAGILVNGNNAAGAEH